MSRLSISRNGYHTSLSSLNNTSEFRNETIYLKCTGNILLQKRIKESQTFNQIEAEKLIPKFRKDYGTKLMLLLTEECILLKAIRRSAKHKCKRASLYYKQIEGVYSVKQLENVIILGIVGSDGAKRSYECWQIDDQESFETFRVLVVQACNNPEHKLINARPIGTLSRMSRNGSVGSLLWNGYEKSYENGADTYEDHSPYRSKSQNDVRASTPYRKPLNLDLYNDTKPKLLGYQMKSCDSALGTDSECNMLPEIVSHSPQESIRHPILTPHISSEQVMNPVYNRTAELIQKPSVQLSSDTDLYPFSQWPAGVTFIQPNKVTGARITHLGSVYMYCDRPPKETY